MTSSFKNLPYNMVYLSVLVRVPLKPKQKCCVLHASLMYTFSRAYGLPYMAPFKATKGLFDTVYCFSSNWFIHTFDASMFITLKSYMSGGGLEAPNCLKN